MWEQLVSSQANRRRNVQNKEKPYSYGDFTEVAIHAAVQTIIQNASPITKPLFSGDSYRDGDRDWIASWILYHLFRNRDCRNWNRSRGGRRSTQRSSTESSNGGSQQIHIAYRQRIDGIVVADCAPLATLKASPTPAFLASASPLANKPTRQEVYDPVRDR